MSHSNDFPVETFPVDRLFASPTQNQLMDLVQPYLAEGETVIWQGQPNPEIEATLYQTSPTTRVVLFFLSSVLLFAAANMFLMPSIEIGVGLKLALVFILGIPGFFTFACFLSSLENPDQQVPRNTFYAITNKRAIRLYPQRPQLEDKFVWKVESFYPKDINIAVSYQSFDKGKFYNICFARQPQEEGQDKWIGFNSVADPEDVIDALRQIRKLNPDAPMSNYDDSVPRFKLEAKNPRAKQ